MRGGTGLRRWTRLDGIVIGATCAVLAVLALAGAVLSVSYPGASSAIAGGASKPADHAVSPARVCYVDTMPAPYRGSCWHVRIYEDGSGCVVVSADTPALDGGDPRRFCGPGGRR